MSQALITLSGARNGLSLAALAQETPDQLRARLRTWYQQALAENFIVQLQLLAEVNGTADGDVFRFTDIEQRGETTKALTVAFDRKAVTVIVVEGERVLCDNRVPGKEMLLPGAWIRRVVSLIEEAEAVQRAKAERERLSEHHEILSLFAPED